MLAHIHARILKSLSSGNNGDELHPTLPEHLVAATPKLRALRTPASPHRPRPHLHPPRHILTHICTPLASPAHLCPRSLSVHPTRLQNVIRAENDRDIYITFEFMETDLHAVIRADILEDVHKRYIMYQVFRALKYVHSARLLHRDLKPSNVLLNSECAVKLADFGLARSLGSLRDDDGTNPALTDYVATRWYRAPEILLSSSAYTTGVDTWAAGCILGELLGGKPLFPGTSTVNQLERILDLVGRPTAHDIASLKSPFAATMLESMRAPAAPRLEVAFPSAPPDALDLLSRLLSFDPARRPSAEEALAHPYCARFHDPADEPSAPGPVVAPFDDDTKLDVAAYRDRLYLDLVRRKREAARRARAKDSRDRGRTERDAKQRAGDDRVAAEARHHRVR